MGPKGTYWASALGVQWVSKVPGDSLVVFYGNEHAEPAARFKVSVLQDDETRARVVKQIILGFAGGRFINGSIVASIAGFGYSHGKITTVEFTTALDEGDGKVGHPRGGSTS